MEGRRFHVKHDPPPTLDPARLHRDATMCLVRALGLPVRLDTAGEGEGTRPLPALERRVCQDAAINADPSRATSPG